MRPDAVFHRVDARRQGFLVGFGLLYILEVPFGLVATHKIPHRSKEIPQVGRARGRGADFARPVVRPVLAAAGAEAPTRPDSSTADWNSDDDWSSVGPVAKELYASMV